MYSVEKYTKFLAQTSDLLSDKRFELTPKKEWLAYPRQGPLINPNHSKGQILKFANHSSQWVAYQSFICVLLINI